MKQRLLLVALALVVCGICNAQMEKYFKVEEDGYKWYNTSKDGKEGAEDVNGHTIVPCEYWMVRYEGSKYDFDPKWFQVTEESENHYDGAYTINGRCIIPTSRHYTWISGSIDEELGTSYVFEKKGIGRGICDVNGQEIVFIEGIDYISPEYKNGKFYYTIKKNNLWGLADGNGITVLEPQYTQYSELISDEKAIAAVTTTKNPLDVQDENPSCSTFSSESLVEELFELAYNTSDSEAQLKYDRYIEVIQADPDNDYGFKAKALNNIGALFENLEDYHNAKEYYEAALEVDPNYGRAKDNLKDVKKTIRSEKWDRIGNIFGVVGNALGNMSASMAGSYNSYQGTSGAYSSSTGSSSSGSYSSGGAINNMGSQQNYNTDKSTYGRYDSMLSAHFYGSRSASGSEVRQWQQTMKRLRTKWEAKGKSFPKSANETKSTNSCASSSHSH